MADTAWTTNLETTATEPVPRLDLDVRATSRRLRMGGWTAEEAANLVARLCGLRIGQRPWTVREIENLLFIRSMADAGRIGGSGEPDPSQPAVTAAMRAQRPVPLRMSGR
jgi:hypothetical protein